MFIKTSFPFLFIVLFCTLLLADTGELTASWERGVEGRIWGDYVLNAQNSIDINHQFMLNALCDHRAFEETAAVRGQMLSVLRDFISANRLNNAVELCGYVLEVYASISIAPLREEERMLLSSLLVRKRYSDRDRMLAGDGRRGEVTLAVSEAVVNVNTPGSDAGKNYTDRRNRDRINGLTGGVNLNIYSLRFDKVDYFSLILYLWEDNPFDRINHTACSSRLNAIPAFLISHNPQCHLSGKNLRTASIKTVGTRRNRPISMIMLINVKLSPILPGILIDFSLLYSDQRDFKMQEAPREG